MHPVCLDDLMIAHSSNAKVTAECVDFCVRALLGDDIPVLPMEGQTPTEGAVRTMDDVIEVHEEQWMSLQSTKQFRTLSPREFAAHAQKAEDDEILATAALASLSMVSATFLAFLYSLSMLVCPCCSCCACVPLTCGLLACRA